MSYEKQTWATGDVITANKLNHIENGIDNIMIVNENTQKTVLDKTFNQIKEAYESGKMIILKREVENESDGAYNYRYYYLIELNYEDGSTPLCKVGFGGICKININSQTALDYVECRSTSPEGYMEIQNEWR